VRALSQDPSQTADDGRSARRVLKTRRRHLSGLGRGGEDSEPGTERFWRMSAIGVANPNASDLLPLRRWPPERYVQLARFLLRDVPEVRIAFTGAPMKRGGGRACAEGGFDALRFVRGKTTLRELLDCSRSQMSWSPTTAGRRILPPCPRFGSDMFGPETPRFTVAFHAPTCRYGLGCLQPVCQRVQ